MGQVFADIEQYASWGVDERFPYLCLSGIFFDETPNLFTNQVEDYLRNISRKVKEANLTLGDKLVRVSLTMNSNSLQ